MNSLKHICDAKNSRLGHELPTSVKYRLNFRDFARIIFSQYFAKKNNCKNFRIYSGAIFKAVRAELNFVSAQAVFVFNHFQLS